MEFARLAAFLDRLEATQGRLEMTGILVELLDDAEARDVPAIAMLVQGVVAPPWEGLELGLAEKMIVRALVAAGAPEKDVMALYRETGDLGTTAERLAAAPRSRQAGLFGPTALDVRDAHAALLEIARASGPGSVEVKQRLLQKLLGEAAPLEARYLVRAVAGKLRLGVADMIFLDALAAWSLGRGVRSVQDMDPGERSRQEALRVRLEHAYDRCSDLARVAGALATSGPSAIGTIAIEPGIPLRPMAAERLATPGEILERHGGRTIVECKYDGLRMQCHVPANGPVRIFSRRLEEMTAQFPDVTQALRAAARRPCIIEGECVAIDAQTGRLRPFQDLSRRRGRKADVEATAQAIPVVLFAFDCLAADGKDALDLPYAERRALLQQCVEAGDGPVRLSAAEEVADEAAFDTVFQRVVQEGGEGVMAKRPDGPYKAGNRGFEWIKFKADYTAGLVDTMDLVVVGAFHGRGRRAGWYGALLMACRDAATGRYASVCKLGTGFDDATLMGLRERLAPHESAARPADVESGLEPDVWLEPRVVMEVQAAELTLSPLHRAAWGRMREGAGLAARFPRFTGRWRTDKGPGQATAADELVAMYRAQGERRSKRS